MAGEERADELEVSGDEHVVGVALFGAGRRRRHEVAQPVGLVLQQLLDVQRQPQLLIS